MLGEAQQLQHGSNNRRIEDSASPFPHDGNRLAGIRLHRAQTLGEIKPVAIAADEYSDVVHGKLPSGRQRRRAVFLVPFPHQADAFADFWRKLAHRG